MTPTQKRRASLRAAEHALTAATAAMRAAGMSTRIVTALRADVGDAIEALPWETTAEVPTVLAAQLKASLRVVGGKDSA